MSGRDDVELSCCCCCVFRFLVPRDMSVGQFIYILSARLHLSPGKALFVFVNNTLPQTGKRFLLCLPQKLVFFFTRFLLGNPKVADEVLGLLKEIKQGPMFIKYRSTTFCDIFFYFNDSNDFITAWFC